MSKSTAAVIMVSPAQLPPWGDEGWRFAGAMQVVQAGPDWLYAQWPVLDGEERHGPDRFASMTLCESAEARAASIAVMAFALLQVPEWRLLIPWWDASSDPDASADVLQGLLEKYAGVFKLAVVQTGCGVGCDVLDALRSYGFEVVVFAQSAAISPKR
jgi:hypothetical protein